MRNGFLTFFISLFEPKLNALETSSSLTIIVLIAIVMVAASFAGSIKKNVRYFIFTQGPNMSQHSIIQSCDHSHVLTVM